jgi:hypothetical protein
MNVAFGYRLAIGGIETHRQLVQLHLSMPKSLLRLIVCLYSQAVMCDDSRQNNNTVRV